VAKGVQAGRAGMVSRWARLHRRSLKRGHGGGRSHPFGLSNAFLTGRVAGQSTSPKRIGLTGMCSPTASAKPYATRFTQGAGTLAALEPDPVLAAYHSLSMASTSRMVKRCGGSARNARAIRPGR